MSMSYNRYPKEMKEAIVARLLEEDVVVVDIQKETGVGINTLYKWRDVVLCQDLVQIKMRSSAS